MCLVELQVLGVLEVVNVVVVSEALELPAVGLLVKLSTPDHSIFTDDASSLMP